VVGVEIGAIRAILILGGQGHVLGCFAIGMATIAALTTGWVIVTRPVGN
jgi:hypothetical protein